MAILPPHIRPGDTIGIVSPSWGGAGFFAHRVEQGIRQLEALGCRVKIGAHALNHQGYVSDTPENRAADLNKFFADPGVRAIVAAIGGDHACHLLPLLDFELIRSHPKIFIGYSDNTVLNVALHAVTGLVTFNGPMLLTDFAEIAGILPDGILPDSILPDGILPDGVLPDRMLPDRMLPYTLESFRKTLLLAEPAGQVEPAGEWTEEFQDWGEKKDLERPRQMLPSPGWTWVKGDRPAEGRLLGGCIESLQHLRGTRYWPDWQGAIFFWETSEEKPLPETIDGMLMDYENMGVFEQIQGMLVGRPMRYSDEEKQALREVILERTRRYAFPVVTDMDFGHTAPQFTLPLGVRARINPAARRFEILEPAVC